VPAPEPVSVVALAGGVGAARFLRGLVEVISPSQVTAVVNTGDDAVFYGVHVSPDLDIVTYTLADRVDRERGYGLEGDSFQTVQVYRPNGEKAVWVRNEFRVDELPVDNTDEFVVQFSIADRGSDHLLEAAIDGVKMRNSYTCVADCEGDVNGDNEVEFDDLHALLRPIEASDVALLPERLEHRWERQEQKGPLRHAEKGPPNAQGTWGDHGGLAPHVFVFA